MRHILYADDDTEPPSLLIKLRAPALIAGLLLGLLISFATSRFEEVITSNVQVAFFLPFIVYMAAAVGTQTEAIYTRDLKSGKARFHNYLIKESVVGFAFGVLFGVLSAAIVHFWFGQYLLAASVGVAMFAAVASAPLIALITTDIMRRVREDPAAGAGPIATVVQDTISIVIYGLICTNILL